MAIVDPEAQLSGGPPPSYQLLREADRVRRRRLGVALAVTTTLTAIVFFLSPQESPLDSFDVRRFGYFGPTRLLPEISILREQQLTATTETHLTDVHTEVRQAVEGGSDLTKPVEGPRAGEAETVPDLNLGDATEEEILRLHPPTVQSNEVILDVLVRPVYPLLARIMGLEAQVTLHALLDTEGRVRRIKVVENTGHSMFVDSARDALYQCQFRPYIQDGKPTVVWVKYPVRFDLR